MFTVCDSEKAEALAITSAAKTKFLIDPPGYEFAIESHAELNGGKLRI